MDPLAAPGAAVLVVDDNAGKRLAVASILEPLGYTIVEAQSGEAALREVMDRTFAVILMDIQMPGMDGYETARYIRMRRESEHTPIIFITAHARDEAQIHVAYASGAVDFIFAPVVPDILRAKVSIFADLFLKTEALEHSVRDVAHHAAALERSNVELQRFAYVASHDLQEPLRKISSYVQILEADYSDRLDDEGRECIQFAVDGAHRMRQLIEDLLTVARVRADNMTFAECDAAAIVAEVLEELGDQVDEIGAVVEVSELPVVFGDASQLRQVFQNLLSNAVKYHDEAAPVIRVDAEATKLGWLFTVADNGVGFKQEYADKVFGMFQRLVGRNQASGTGIGLAIVRKAVENHGGLIWAQSEPGVGSTFRFTLLDRAAYQASVGYPQAA